MIDSFLAKLCKMHIVSNQKGWSKNYCYFSVNLSWQFKAAFQWKKQTKTPAITYICWGEKRILSGIYYLLFLRAVVQGLKSHLRHASYRLQTPDLVPREGMKCPCISLRMVPKGKMHGLSSWVAMKRQILCLSSLKVISVQIWRWDNATSGKSISLRLATEHYLVRCQLSPQQNGAFQRLPGFHSQSHFHSLLEKMEPSLCISDLKTMEPWDQLGHAVFST